MARRRLSLVASVAQGSGPWPVCVVWERRASGEIAEVSRIYESELIALLPERCLLLSRNSSREIALLQLGSPRSPVWVKDVPRGHLEGAPWRKAMVLGNGRWVVAKGEKGVSAWDTGTGAHDHLKGRVDHWLRLDDSRILLARGPELAVWGIDRPGEIRRLGSCDQRWFSALGASPGGRRALSAGEGNEIHAWDLTTGTKRLVRRDGSHVNCLAALPDGRRALSGAALDRRLLLWDIETGALLGAAALSDEPRDIAVLRDGRVVVADDGGELRIFRV